MEIFAPFLIVILLILVNGIFVAAEFAIVGATRGVIEKRAAEGQPTARMVLAILLNPRLQDRYLATAQIGITLASLGLGMYGESTLAFWLAQYLEGLGAGQWATAHVLASAIAIAFLTYFHIVLGEMVPKSLALRHAETTAFWIVRPMRWARMLFYPLVIALNGLGNAMLRLMGIKRQFSAAHYFSPEELDLIVQESREKGLLRPESGRLVHELFEFGELTAGEVMVPRVRMQGLPADTSPSDWLPLVRGNPHTRYPVYEEHLDRILGVVHIKDLLRLALRGTALTRESVRPIPFVPESASLDAVLEAMRRARTQLAVVMDEQGGTAGLISVEDLYEEIVGPVDESQAAKPEIRRESPERLLVAGTVRLAEVGEHLGVELAHKDVDTVSGLVLALLQRPPVPGDVVTWAKVRFEVRAVKGHGVAECTVTKVASEGSSASTINGG